MTTQPGFRGDRNVALRVPPQPFDQIVVLYRDMLGMQRRETAGRSEAFRA